MLLLLMLFNLFSIILIFVLPVRYCREISLWLTVLLFLSSLFFLFYFQCDLFYFQFVWFIEWSLVYNFYIFLGLDGISLFFVLLTTFLIPFCFLVSWVNIVYRVKEFLIFMFFIEFFLLCVFSVLDLFFFYIFFESILLPMFLLVGLWGSRHRKIHASFQFFLYTLFGSLFFLLSVIYIFNLVGTTDIAILRSYQFTFVEQVSIWCCFFLSFAVKIPMVPVHIWLPEAHVEAPTAGSVLLAGLLLKMGGYAILRFMLPLLQDANFYFLPFIYGLSVVAIIYTSLITIRQVDLKKIIAYSSVAHMNYVILGLFSLNLYGLEGGVYMMLSHGLVSPALFICVGFLYDRYKTRILRYFGGFAQMYPLLCFFFFFFSLANMSFPGTSSFIGEIAIMLGVFIQNTLVALYANLGMILGGIYVMWLVNRVFFGNLLNTMLLNFFSDLNKREFFMVFYLALYVLFFGFFTNSIFAYLHSGCILILANLNVW